MVGGWEILVILCIVLILFGGKRLPELARNLGKGIKEFKKASADISEEIHRPTETQPTQREATPPPQLEEEEPTSHTTTARVTTTAKR